METENVSVGTAEHQRIKEDEDKGAADKRMEGEESRKAGKPTSRIPTFQSSLARKRTTTPTAESSLPVKTDGPVREGLMKERGIVSGEPLRTKLPVFGDRETTLPSRIQSSSTENLSLSDSSDPISETSEDALFPLKRNHSPEPKTYTARSSEGLEESLQRPSLRAEIEPHVTSLFSEPSHALQSDSMESFSKEEEEEDSDSASQDEVTEGLSISTASPEELLPALSVKMEPSQQQEHCEDMKSFAEDSEKTHLKESTWSPHGVKEPVLEDTDKQCPVLKTNEKRPVDVSSETPLKQKSPHVSSKSKTVDSALVENSKPTPKSSGARGKSFALFCFFPTLLLLLGGFGQHIWLYGVPKSVSHLMVQLELHWLEGFWLPQEECSADCRLTLVESLPEGMLFPRGSPHLQSISHTWTSLLNRANSSVDIAAFYLTLRDLDTGLTEPSAIQGKELFSQLKQLQSRGVNLKIAVNAPQTSRADTDELAGTGAEIREVDLQSVTGGIVHTKLWVVDKKHMYVGSANMDWRSLTQVKEVGVSVEDCSCLAQDALRIFSVYWEIGSQKNGSLPPYWPGRFSALSSSKYPLAVKFNGVPARVYLSSAPPQLSAYGRSDDLSTILSVIADAKEFIYVSVMDYIPMSQFTQPLRFWPAIDSALREAACARGVEVKLLVSCWKHSPGAMFVFLQSLAVLGKTPLRCNIHVKVFEVPSTPEQLLIPFARVNHAKYMVTDRVVYIGTSNWSENYFSQTAGVGLVVNQTDSVVEKGHQTVQNQLQEIFQRDWNSDFTQALTDDHAEHCSHKKNL
ncbi:5'-3' exonuclease PLD3 isoform X2 [Salminus brasiliensis]|uniref:5'-3' exonuclease PLD3 isoform X2 n=1 Tax=Salminus brasiliensis TaxID=930266 RepID=UPI003B834678